MAQERSGAARAAWVPVPRTGTTGFTLVELLVAIGILALVAVMGWRGLDGIVRARFAVTEQMETTRGMQLAFAQLQSDAERIVNPKDIPTRPYFVADSQSLVLVRVVTEEDAPTRLQVVSYRIENNALVRRESAATRDLSQLDVLWKAATSNLSTGQSVKLQDGVQGMGVRIWNGNWLVPTSPLVGETGVPTGLEVALQVQGQSKNMVKSFLLGGA
jgi:general secretion pathway protein J